MTTSNICLVFDCLSKSTKVWPAYGNKGAVTQYVYAESDLRLCHLILIMPYESPHVRLDQKVIHQRCLSSSFFLAKIREIFVFSEIIWAITFPKFNFETNITVVGCDAVECNRFPKVEIRRKTGYIRFMKT